MTVLLWVAGALVLAVAFCWWDLRRKQARLRAIEADAWRYHPIPEPRPITWDERRSAVLTGSEPNTPKPASAGVGRPLIGRVPPEHYAHLDRMRERRAEEQRQRDDDDDRRRRDDSGSMLETAMFIATVDAFSHSNDHGSHSSDSSSSYDSGGSSDSGSSDSSSGFDGGGGDFGGGGASSDW